MHDRTSFWRTGQREFLMVRVEGVLHFTIPAKDLDRSEKFYTEILGFQKIAQNERIVFLRAGNDYFNLTYSENPIATNVGGRPPLFQHVVHVASTDRANVNVPRGIVIQNYRPNESVMKPIMPGESVGLPRIAVNGSIRHP